MGAHFYKRAVYRHLMGVHLMGMHPVGVHTSLQTIGHFRVARILVVVRRRPPKPKPSYGNEVSVKYHATVTPRYKTPSLRSFKMAGTFIANTALQYGERGPRQRHRFDR
jgi:hypothetical protein